MIGTILRWRLAVPASLLCLALVTACGALDVSDPTAIEDSELDDAQGAELLRKGALGSLYAAVGNSIMESGIVADEIFADPPAFYQTYGIIYPNEILDRRDNVRYEQLWAQGQVGGAYEQWQRARALIAVALPKMRAFSPVNAHTAELYAARATTTLRLAEDYCPGFPLHEVEGYAAASTGPYSTVQAFETALADLDTAVTLAADSARVLSLVQVLRGRVLLQLDRSAEAASAVATVPTSYVSEAQMSDDGYIGQFNWIGYITNYQSESVADGEGGNGLDFVSAHDPRVDTDPYIVGADGVTQLYSLVKYPTAATPVIVASGIEARLIEAEDALRRGANWLETLNTLRTSGTQTAGIWNPGTGGVAGLAPLTDPVDPAQRVDLLFRERAFWLFGTGRRLADLRRLVRDYDREPDAVFPSGANRLGGTYQTGTSIPFPGPIEAQFNSAISTCTSR